MLSTLVCLFLFLHFGKKFGSSVDDLPQVDTLLGRVRGSWKESMDGRKYAAFEGIPYAKPPIGDLRFEEAEPATPWTGVWEANNPQTCMQAGIIGYTETKGEEDCLYLNVYMPADHFNTSKQLDVIVSIHGGAFMIGSGHTMTDSRMLMDRDIILVSPNYRLGILGFLSTEDNSIPGNNGLKDQILALKWIKDNIPSFGGNPDSVTIIGLSAGGGSVHLHYLSPLSKGLFHRGMAQSGTVLTPWVIRKNARQRAKKLANLVGCPSSPTKDLKKCLKQRPAHNVLSQLRHFYQSEKLPLPCSPFAPVVEKQSPKAFLNREPYLLLKEGKVTDVPLITSFTADDGLLFSAMFWKRLEYVNENWKDLSRYILDYNDTLPVPFEDHVVDDISEYFLGAGEGINKDTFKKFTKMCTDRMFGSPAEMIAKMQAKVMKSPVYFYIFNYQKGGNKMVNFYSGTDDLDGVAHADDAIYFYGLNVFNKPLNEQDLRLKNVCQDILHSFATTGVPSFDRSDSWQPTGSTELTYLNITGPDNMRLQTVEKLSSISFWAKLGLRENEYFVHNQDE